MPDDQPGPTERNGSCDRHQADHHRRSRLRGGRRRGRAGRRRGRRAMPADARAAERWRGRRCHLQHGGGRRCRWSPFGGSRGPCLVGRQRARPGRRGRGQRNRAVGSGGRVGTCGVGGRRGRRRGGKRVGGLDHLQHPVLRGLQPRVCGLPLLELPQEVTEWGAKGAGAAVGQTVAPRTHAARGLLLQHRHDRVDDLGRQPRRHRAERRGHLEDLGARDGLEAHARYVLERMMAREQLVGEHAHLVDVGVAADLLAQQLLGRSRRRRAHERPGDLGAATGRLLDDAEVDELDDHVAVARLEEDVVALDVPVHKALLVHALQALEHLHDHAARQAPVEHAVGLAVDELGQGPALEQLHQDARTPLRAAVAEDPHDVAVA